MRSLRLVLPVVAALALLWRAVAVRSDEGAVPPAPVLHADPPTGALLVDLADDADAGDRARVAAELVRAIAPRSWPAGPRALGERLSAPAQLYRIRPPASETADVLRSLGHDPEVEGVEPERTWSLLPGELAVRLSDAPSAHPAAPPARPWRPGRFVPDDPYYRYQWHLDLIGMPEAWARSRGDGVVVAVVDTGVLYRDAGRFRRAPDLAATRFVAGHDFVDGDDAPDDAHGHGTHVAGTVAQSTHNGIGVAGVAPGAAIMPIRVLDGRGVGRWGSVAAGIRWAADHGADVINLSLGGGMPSSTIGRAIDRAHRRGVVVVAAAGNTGRSGVSYPAADRHVIAVGAVRYDETRAFYSSFGRNLDLVAPGGDLRVDQNGDGLPDGVLQNTMVGRDPSKHDYVAWQGTSMATPHVAGAAALLRASGVTDPDAVADVLERTAKPEGSRRRYGAGLVQAQAAVELAEQGVGGLRALAAGALCFAVLFGLGRRGRLDVAPVPTTLWALGTAGGLAVLPWHWLPVVGGEGAILARGAAALVGAGGPVAAALLIGPLVPLVLAGLLLGVRWARPPVVGIGLGLAALGLQEAVLPVVAAGPGPGWLWGAWLVVGGLVTVGLARLAATRA